MVQNEAKRENDNIVNIANIANIATTKFNEGWIEEGTGMVRERYDNGLGLPGNAKVVDRG